MEDKRLIEINDLKKMSLEDLMVLLSDKSNNSIIIEEKSSDKTVFNTEQLLKTYPMFTKYNLDIAIKKEGLPFFKIGRIRYFDVEAIDKWIETSNKPLITATVKKRTK